VSGKSGIKKAKTLEAMSKHLNNGVNTDNLTKEQINKLQLQKGILEAS
jgi:hypothetical protein